MKTWWRIIVPVLLVALIALLWLRWKQDEPRRCSLAALENLSEALKSNNSAPLLDAIVLPRAIQGRTAPEQAEFLRKALRDEISPEGIAVLKSKGTFGPLKEVFPSEAELWADQAGVKAGDCVAFKLERNGLRTEVVLATGSALRTPKSAFKIVRCNNVKQ